MPDTDSPLKRLEQGIHRLKRRLVLLRPRRVDFQVDGRAFTIFGTYSANRGLGHDFARNGCHEPVLSRLLIDALERSEPDTSYWDVGSALGYFVAIAGTLIPPERVHAFEPGSNFGYLAFNNRRLFNGRVRANRAFASHASRGDGSAVALDDYARQWGDPGIIKIDVDGGEADVIAGAMETLRRARPVIFLEVHFVGGPPYPELRERLTALLGDLPYRYELCLNHRRPDGAIDPLESIESLPRKKDERFDDNDYLLIARPANNSD